MSVYQIKNNTEEMKIVSINGKDELIPENWKINNLEKICFYNKNKFKKLNEDIIYIDISEVKDYRIQNGKYIENNDIPSRANTVLHGDEILLSMVRPNLKTIAFSGEKEKNKIASSGLAVLSYKYVNIKYVYYMFKCDKFVILFSKIANGGNYPSLSKADLNAVEVIFPEDNDEQKKIAEHLSFIENTIFKTEKLISEKEKELRYYSRELLSGKLRVKKDINGNIEFYDNTHWKTVVINKKEVNIPENWNVNNIGNIMSMKMGDNISQKQFHKNGKIPVFSATSSDKYVGYTDEKSKYTYLCEGDIVIPARGNIGFVKYVSEKTLSTHTTISCKNVTNNNSKLLFYIFKEFKNNLFKNTGSAIPQLTIESLNDKEISISNNQEEQDLITSLLQDGEKEIEKYNKLLDSLKSRLKGDMQKLLTGDRILGRQIV